MIRMKRLETYLSENCTDVESSDLLSLMRATELKNHLRVNEYNVFDENEFKKVSNLFTKNQLSIKLNGKDGTQYLGMYNYKNPSYSQKLGEGKDAVMYYIVNSSNSPSHIRRWLNAVGRSSK